MQVFSRTCRTSTSRAASRRANSSTRCNRATWTTLYKLAPDIQARVAKLDCVRDVGIDLYVKNPQMTIDVDREAAAIYGITVDQVRQELFNAFGARQVATIYTPSSDYQIILESLPEFRPIPPACPRSS